MTQTNADFQKHIRQALNHLYHPEQLRKSALVEWFGLSERHDAHSALQRTLTEAIHALRPNQYEPLHSELRKTFEILLMRYIQQFNQQEVAHHIGVSERQFRREQDRAIDILAEYLWKKFPPNTRLTAVGKMTPAQSTQSVQPAANSGLDIDAEWGWIKNTYSERVTNTFQFISGIINLIQSVASQYQVVLKCNSPEHLPDLAVHPVALRQILLNLLRVAIAHARAGDIHLNVVPKETILELQVTSHLPSKLEGISVFKQEGNLLEIASHLTNLSNGHLELEDQAEGFRAKLFLPVVDGVSVLVVDDSRDIIELLKRYTTGTRYHIRGIEDPTQVFQAIESSGARMIILDVMMPKIDGWELLGRLRQHPLTDRIPVVIFSILAQEELALALGARAMLVKPVTQEKFLAVMDRVYAILN